MTPNAIAVRSTPRPHPLSLRALALSRRQPPSPLTRYPVTLSRSTASMDDSFSAQARPAIVCDHVLHGPGKLRHSEYDAQTLGPDAQLTSPALHLESPFYPENMLKVVWTNEVQAQTIAAEPRIPSRPC